MDYNALGLDPLYLILRKDSYEEGFEEGLKEGRVQGFLQQMAINVVAKRFPGLKERVQEVIATVSDPQRLQELIPEFSVLSQEEVEEVLDQLCKQQLQEEADL